METTFDFQEAPEGSVISHDFIVWNTGSTVLTIDQVGPACGCITADFDESIAPGGEGRITLTVNLAGIEGPLEKMVMVVSNDPENADATLSIKGTAKPSFRAPPPTTISSRSVDKPINRNSVRNSSETQIAIKPKSIALGRKPSGKPASSESITVISNQRKPFKITKLIYDKKLLRVTTKPLPRQGGFSLLVSANMASIPAGPALHTVLNIQTDLDSRAEAKVDVRLFSIKQQTLPPSPKGVVKVR
jgi:hypothetical protein